MRGSTKRWAVVVCCGALVAASCSADDEPEATAPVPTADAEQELPSTDDTAIDVDDDPGTSEQVADGSGDTTPPETDPPQTDPPETTTTTEAAPERRLTEDLGPVTDSIPYPDAPGVDAPGEFYEIYDMGYVYVPFEDDPNDSNVVAPTADSLPIIAAYAEAQGAIAQQTFADSVSAEPNERIRSIYADQGEGLARETLQRFASEGLRDVFLFDAADIYRPRVVVATDVSATLSDCQSVSSATVDSTGQPLFADIRPYFEFGQSAEMARVDGQWLVDSIASDPEACQ